MRRSRVVLLGLIAACKSDGKRAPASVGSAPPPPVVDARPQDAAVHAVASIEAVAPDGGPATDGADAGAAPLAAGGTATGVSAAAFYLVARGVPLDAELMLGELEVGEGDGATGDGAITADADGGMYVAVRPLPTVPARYRASIGARIELHDDRHVVCTATIGAAVAVRYGTISGDPGVALRTAKTPLPAAPMWAEDKEGVHIFGSYLAAPLVDASGDCSTALFATAVGRTFTLTRVAAAKEWEAAAPDVFMNAREPGLASEKNALEGGDTPIRFTSVRRLGPAEGPSYALLYGVAETRVIIVERVPGPDLAAGRELASVYAQSPSSVTGVDADGDGAMDVVIGHPGGVSLVKSTGEFLTLSGGVLETEHD